MLPLLVCLIVGAGIEPSDSQLQSFVALRGRVTLQAPAAWHILRSDSDDSSAVFVFHVRDPATDTAGSDRTNIVITVRLRTDTLGLQTFSNAAFDQMMTGLAPAVLNDVSHGDSTRSIFWRGQMRQTPYAVLDKFAVRRHVYLKLRFSMPMVKSSTPEWTDRTLAELNNVVRSIAIDGSRLFRDDDPLEIAPFE